MKKIVMATCLLLISFIEVNGQNIVKGIVVDSNSEKPLSGVLIKLKNTKQRILTNIKGVFNFENLLKRSSILEISFNGYETQNFPIELTGKTIDLGTVFLYKNLQVEEDLSIITLTDDELNDDTSAADNISGLLQASKDIYLRTAAFEFSSSFFRIKGLDSGNGKVLINGIEMNKIFDGRAQWSNWGGLNDVLRNQEFSNGLSASSYTFGGVLGSTNISTRASQQRPGTSISYSSSNRSYEHRFIATHATGMINNGWSMTFSTSRRVGNEGFNEGTTYNAYSLFAAVEKKLNDKHSLALTAIFTPNRRGKSSPNTQEIFDIKGITYNEYWGFLNGKKVNSRIKEVKEPILMLNHYWDVSKNTSLQTNVAYQFGNIGNSRLDFNGGANPSPSYYQYLPSYQLRNGDLAGAYEALQNFKNDGQLDWNRIFEANLTNANFGVENAYVIYEDRVEDKQLSVNTIFNSEINNNITLNAKIEYKRLRSNSFANIIDLLGGIGYLDINNFADTESERQNNLLNPNFIAKEGDTFKYNYNINSDVASAFLQSQFKSKKLDFFVAANLSKTSHQREGLYQNGRFTDNSLGKSKKLQFTNYGLKAGATYKITGRHLINANASFFTDAPTIRNSFSNSRENNNTVENLTSEKVFSTDLSYIVRSPIITSRLTAYYTSVKDATEISFYFGDGIGGDNTAFVQEILSGIQKKHLGIELGVEAQVTSSIKLKGAASIGQFTYANNPNLYLTSDITNEGVFDKNGRSGDYTANLNNYKLAAGPQNAYSIGFEYRDPSYWFIGATANFFSNTYVDVAPLNRSSNFFTDSDGLPFLDYDLEIAKELLNQEKFDAYKVINLIGGKSWKVNDKFISVFATVNNLLGKEYKSGGFEQGRNANYRELKSDKTLDIPVFGNKYWYGRGATYFLNISIRF
ncbi:carboxypeptidase-like regulatory domain-containing protein [Polaribacter ponticola]|uniref:Carboxypeptidase-like regulatory domain-containing protein n=1 Tax=Polaribacter ponticola TaxID=2978475 RepID=A0ABT5SAP1_9FLAO|nr:carboxypeptidase-like regulatory domain-containing protein [Polaribacter sp. MSW5]MDD7915155.1 carboxypeptidase-like regulatory domain-containing protein [Polaribacter sp. MSW5]